MLSLCHDQGLEQMGLDELAIIQDEARRMEGPRAICLLCIGGEGGESTRRSAKVGLIDSAKSRV